MLLALLAGSALGSMPLPLYSARSMDVSGVPVLASLPGPAWIWADVTLDTAGQCRLRIGGDRDKITDTVHRWAVAE
jgi:hypothetical protein